MRLMKHPLAVVLLLVPMAAWAWPWSTDMADQPAIEPQHPVVDGAMMPFPARSVPVTGIPTPYRNREETRELENPYRPTDAASIAEGRMLFKIYCATCHGPAGTGGAPVGLKIGAIPLVDTYVQDFLTEGWVFGTITFGSALMPAYGIPSSRADRRGSNDLSIEERWHVVNYVKNAMLKEAQAMSTRTAEAGQAQ
jgi:S-disulfanyl-L-cysteine oxidoreductase SoxD